MCTCMVYTCLTLEFSLEPDIPKALQNADNWHMLSFFAADLLQVSSTFDWNFGMSVSGKGGPEATPHTQVSVLLARQTRQTQS